MVPDKEPRNQHIRDIENTERYFKVTPKGRAPKVTREWNADDKPWYIRYAFDWMLLLIAVPFIVASMSVTDDSWAAFSLDVVLIGIFFMWLETQVHEVHDRY
jgi:hypothetical protein